MYRLTTLASTLIVGALLCGPYATVASDRSGFDKALLTKWHTTTGDFNGDGQVDRAWLAFDDKQRCELIVEVAGHQYTLTHVPCYGRLKLYLATLEPGVYASVCAKVYRQECYPDELRSVTLEHDGLLFGQQEVSTLLLYWNGDGFSRIFLSE